MRRHNDVYAALLLAAATAAVLAIPVGCGSDSRPPAEAAAGAPAWTPPGCVGGAGDELSSRLTKAGAPKKAKKGAALDSACAHEECTTGEPLEATCSTCATTVCAADPYCCNPGATWDVWCVADAQALCGESCGAPAACNHGPCNPGTVLGPSCSSCAATICQEDPYCCHVFWDSNCAAEAAEYSSCGCAEVDCLSTSSTPPGGCVPSAAACDPFTNDGCNDSAGEVCQLEVGLYGEQYFCYGPPSDAGICGECSYNEPCDTGLTCYGGRCAMYCCNDVDCGVGVCDHPFGASLVGVCVVP